MSTSRHIRVITALVVALLLVVGMAEASLAQSAAEQEGAPLMEENEAQTPSMPETGSEDDASATPPPQETQPSEEENEPSDNDVPGVEDETPSTDGSESAGDGEDGTQPPAEESQPEEGAEEEPPEPPAPFADLVPAIEGPKAVEPGDLIQISISTVAEGSDSPLETSGLEFIAVDSELCHEGYVVVIPAVPEGETLNTVTYTYKVSEDAVDKVSLSLTDLHIAVENPPYNIASLPVLTWSAPVEEDIPEAARSLRSRSHYYDLDPDSGFAFGMLSDGSSAIKGLGLSRTPSTVASYAEQVIAPEGGSVRVRDAEGNILASDDTIRTGCILEVLDAAQRVLEESVVIVRGDILGTGTASIMQVGKLTGALCGEWELTELQLMAADHNDNSKLDMTDIVKQARYLL